MALVSSSHRDHRIYEPSLGCDYPTRQELSEFRCRLLIKIHDSYSKALERLNLRARPSMAARFLYGGGFCFGLLDPVSNIIANTLAPYKPRKSEGSTAGIVTQSKLRELERRSLDGLVTFLTRFFPYLADCEAVRYLLLADADVLVAARIIALDRHMKNFGSFGEGIVVGDAFKMALKCAALAARHPEPDGFVSFWAVISDQPRVAVSILSRLRRRSPCSIYQNITFTDLLDSSFTAMISDAVTMDRNQKDSDSYLWRAWSAWHLAASRRPRRCSVPYQHTTPLKRILLDTIHGFYLEALARLPAGELQSRYHRSLLTAGHCYGPLDPVSNIILNTIWYDATFPPTHQLKMDMVSTLSLHRIENRSMYGIISFLCTRYHHLDFHQAARCLLHADANLLGADPNLDAAASLRMKEATQDYWHPLDHLVKWSTRDGFPAALGKVDTLDKGPDTSVNEAFKAAAVAGCHPKPDDQVNLFASYKQKLGSALSLLQGCEPLSTTDVQQLARLLCPESPCSEQTLPPFPLEEYLYKYARISKKVNSVLNACNQMTNGEPMYHVHIICGVNSQVSGPVYCSEGSKFAPHKCFRTHVNFLATCREAQSEADTAKMFLFFAELSNDDEDEVGAQSFCCHVPLPQPCAERVRCLYCDYVGTRIVHPIKEDFHGREQEFEKMVCGEDPCDKDFNPAVNRTIYNNLSVIRNSRLVANKIGSLEEDCLYAESFDRPRHAHFDDFALFMDDCDSSGGSLTDDFDASD